jgi:hypothetical protein
MERAVLIAYFLFAVSIIGVCMWAVIDAAVRPTWAWKAAARNQLVWVLLLLILQWIVVIPYFAVIRPRVKAAQHAPPLP